MQRQPQLCRKKSAFRNKIRQQHIQRIFKQCRQQYSEQQANSYCNNNSAHKNSNIKQIDQFRIGSASKVKPEYPFQAILYDQNGEGRTSCTFYTSEQVHQYIAKVIAGVPASIHTLVHLLTNNPKLAPQLVTYLLPQLPPRAPIPHPLSSLTHPFTQSTISQFISYIYILQSLLLHLQQGSKRRRYLILQTKQQVSSKTLYYINSNKIVRNDVLRAYFDYIVVVGDDVRLWNCLEVTVLVQFVRDVFGGWTMEGQFGGYDVYDSVVVVCNTIVSLNSHASSTASSSQQSEQYYNTELLKQSFTSQLLANPKPLKNMILSGIQCQTNQQLQHILRFFINLTYIISKPQDLYIFVDGLVLLINSILSQWKLLTKLSIINVLMLRLVNNVAVSDVYSAQVLWREAIITRIVAVYGQFVLQQCPYYDHNCNSNGNGNGNGSGNANTSRQAPQSHVYSQFISTISTYIILLNTHNPRQTNFTDNLTQLITHKHIHLILLQSLTLPYISHGQTEIIAKILQAYLILSNYESTTLKSTHVMEALDKYEQLLESLYHGISQPNVGVLCEELLQALHGFRDKREDKLKMDMEYTKEQLKYEAIMREIQMEDKTTNKQQ